MLLAFVLLIFTSGIIGYERQNIVSDVYLRFYINDIKNYKEFNLTDPLPLLDEPNFNMGKKTVIYIHGYKEYLDWENTQTVIGAYLKRGDHNPISLDWTNMNRGDYVFNAVPNTQTVGRALATAIEILVDNGLDPDLIHLVGHSLGAHVAGFAGQLIDGFQIYRITHLDAAYPGFYYVHASEDDAQFVDSIHTDASIYGYPTSIGKADFWVNGGKRHQPGCPLTFLPIQPKILSDTDLCSHWRSWRFWAESLLNEKAFPAMRCWRGVKKKSEMHRHHNDIQGYMGYSADSRLAGDYCLITKDSSPFSLGTTGM